MASIKKIVKEDINLIIVCIISLTVVFHTGCYRIHYDEITTPLESKLTQAEVISDSMGVSKTDSNVVIIIDINSNNSKTASYIQRKMFHKAFDELNHDESLDSLDRLFLEGYLCFKTGQYARAESVMINLMDEEYPLNDWVRYLAAASAFRNKDYILSNQLIRTVGKLPGLLEEIGDLRWQNHWELGDTKQAFAQLDSAFNLGFFERLSFDLRNNTLLRKVGRIETAQVNFLAMLNILGVSKRWDLADDIISELKKIRRLDPVVYFYIGQTYYTLNQFDSSIVWFNKYLELNNKKYSNKAKYYLAISLTKTKHYAKSLDILRRMLKDNSYNRGSLWWRISQCRRKQNKISKAWEAIDSALVQCKDCGNGSNIVLERIFLAKRQRDWEKFAVECRRMLRKYPSSYYADISAIWGSLAFIKIGKTRTAIDLLNQNRTHFSKPDFLDEYDYWTAYAYSLTDSTILADSMFSAIARSPRENVFVWKSRERMGWSKPPVVNFMDMIYTNSDSVVKYVSEQLSINVDSLPKLPNLKIKANAEHLHRLGITEFSLPCFKVIERESQMNNKLDGLLVLWKYYYDLGIYNYATAKGINLSNKMSYLKSSASMMMAYPTPYHELVDQYAKSHDVHPAIIYAIMRQESRFDPYAKSYANARGLMQFIPATGKTVADWFDIKDFHEDDLYDHSMNILFGAKFFDYLMDKRENLYVALAEYNAGASQIKRWEQECPISDNDLVWTEFIDYRQTRLYVKKVMSNLYTYEWIYKKRN